ncbi:MAG TPA: CARDB domain-containing protein [Solirubrobacterales bacterium]
MSLKSGESTLIRVKVKNTGATGTGGGSLRVRGAKGVVVKPERQAIPALAPGKSWTVTVRVALDAKAKKSSTLALTAAASGVTASGTLSVKLRQ